MVGQNIIEVTIIWVRVDSRTAQVSIEPVSALELTDISEYSLCLSTLLCNTEKGPCQEGARKPMVACMGEGKS